MISKDLPFKIDFSPAGVDLSYSFSMPAITLAASSLTDLAFGVGVNIPFDGRPLATRISVSEKAKPFMLTVGPLGGRGFFALSVSAARVERVEVSLEFGAAVALDFGVASGRLYAMGGIYYCASADSLQLYGFFKAGGSLKVLFVFHAAVDFYLGMGFGGRRASPVVAGEAELEDLDHHRDRDSDALDQSEEGVPQQHRGRAAAAPPEEPPGGAVLASLRSGCRLSLVSRVSARSRHRVDPPRRAV